MMPFTLAPGYLNICNNFFSKILVHIYIYIYNLINLLIEVHVMSNITIVYIFL